ncbi:MAG: C10 family peptidase [Bacteroidales bacterium]|nr:C10 family peptidase [Bacteroidales bacterium]
MKRLVTMLAILLIALQAMATPVSEGAAKTLAENFLHRSAARLTLKGKVPAQTVGKQRIPLKATAASTPAYYVFNFDEGGFVIVSGENGTAPILAYSTTGSFTLEGAPSNIKWWMDGLASEIGLIREGKSAPRKSAREVFKVGTPVIEYATAKWYQDEPYNNECPQNGLDEYDNKVRSVTGCVATAGAIVARYFQWPAAGEGTTDAYSYVSDDIGTYNKNGEWVGETQTIPAKTLGRSYDWANMPLTTLTKNSPTAQKAAVAALMFDIGTASQMQYNYYYGSGTFDNNLLAALVKHFHYNKAAYQAPRSGYTDEEWHALLQKNLREVGPMVYGGVDPDPDEGGGHEFVFDGYDNQNYYRVNWGWNGSDDGYYLLDNLGSGFNFSDSQSTLINLKPDDGTSTYRDDLVLTPYNNYNGLSTTATSFSTGTTFYMRASNFFNNAVMPFNGNVYFAVYDKNGNWKENISPAKSITNLKSAYVEYLVNGNFQESYFTTSNCKITGAIKGGDRIRLHYVGQYSSGFARSDDPSVTWEIVISDLTGPSAAEIAAATSFTWVKSNKTINTSTTLDDGISITMKNAAGQTVYSQNAMTKNAVYSINCANFASGTYTLVYGGGEDYTLTLTF